MPPAKPTARQSPTSAASAQGGPLASKLTVIFVVSSVLLLRFAFKILFCSSSVKLV